MSIVHDFRVDRTQAHAQKCLDEMWQVRLRAPPPQIVKEGDWFGGPVKIVFADTGETVPWQIISVHCPKRFLWRHDVYNAPMMETGDFCVEWGD